MHERSNRREWKLLSCSNLVWCCIASHTYFGFPFYFPPRSANVTGIRNIENLTSCTSIRTLKLSGNQVCSVGLYNRLDSSNWENSVISTTMRLPSGGTTSRLIRFDWKQTTQIQQIRGLEGLRALERLDLSCNNIRRIGEDVRASNSFWLLTLY